jgi:hypothetical protein
MGPFVAVEMRQWAPKAFDPSAIIGVGSAGIGAFNVLA